MHKGNHWPVCSFTCLSLHVCLPHLCALGRRYGSIWWANRRLLLQRKLWTCFLVSLLLGDKLAIWWWRLWWAGGPCLVGRQPCHRFGLLGSHQLWFANLTHTFSWVNLVFIPGSDLTDKFFLDNCSHDDHFSLAAAEKREGRGRRGGGKSEERGGRGMCVYVRVKMITHDIL